MKFNKIFHSDIDEIGKLQPIGWTDIVPVFKFYIDSPYCRPICVKQDNKIIGIGASIRFEKTCWLAHIIVKETFRKTGIGNGIVKELLTYSARYSINTWLLVATELGQPIYIKLGFKVIGEYLFFIRKIPWAISQAPRNIVSYNEGFYSRIIEMDKEISGENRETLIHNHIKNSIVYIECNKPIGYYLPGLEEGPIIACTNEAGVELMKVKYSTVDKAVIPSVNYVGIEFLKDNGFIETETKVARMILGNDVDWKPECIFSRISGNFG